MPNILGLKDWKVLERNHNDHDMVITAEYSVAPPACVRCGIVNPKLNKYGVQEQTFMDTPIHGKRVGIKVMRQRFRCQECGKTFQQALPDMDEKRTMTRRLLDYIRQRSLERTFTEVAHDAGVNEKTVRNIFVDYVKELDAQKTPTVSAKCKRGVSAARHQSQSLTGVPTNRKPRPRRAGASGLHSIADGD